MVLLSLPFESVWHYTYPMGWPQFVPAIVSTQPTLPDNSRNQLRSKFW
jgi:hypothetical protein